jgi:hypothetical protein
MFTAKMSEELLDWRTKALQKNLHGIIQGTNHECLCPDGSIFMITRSGNTVFVNHSIHRPIPFLKSIGLLEDRIYMEHMTGITELKQSLLETQVVRKLIQFHRELKEMIDLYQDLYLETNYFLIWSDCDLSDEDEKIHFQYTSWDSNIFHLPIQDGEFSYTKIPKVFKQEFILKIREINQFIGVIHTLIYETPSLFIS